MWVAGGGFKAGHIHGATDEFGHQAVENVVNHYDYHATLLHLFGLDPKKLTFKRNGTDQTLVENRTGARGDGVAGVMFRSLQRMSRTTAASIRHLDSKEFCIMMCS